MIHRSLLALSTATLVALLATPARDLLMSPSAPATAAVAPASAASKLEQYMEEINKGFRRLRNDLKDPKKNVDSLALVRNLGDLAGKSRLETPEITKSIPESDRAQFLVDFQLAMVEFDHKLLELERALIEGDNATAETLRSEANELKSPAHKKFKAPDDKGQDKGK